ncbi:hypothetical protein QBC46DRAFT_346134 [Diplogelasinospora grovesii]|uniref:Uncharacterized protein n=1 Tax=Diplogelasinospora grovesii TaxID=303347 RepID=A0AAN6MYJ0_9PEZI|nr:hypothetical protein QBC46DRAFT_346134 [Diplogelasinospora grovesii]
MGISHLVVWVDRVLSPFKLEDQGEWRQRAMAAAAAELKLERIRTGPILETTRYHPTDQYHNSSLPHQHHLPCARWLEF